MAQLIAAVYTPTAPGLPYSRQQTEAPSTWERVDRLPGPAACRRMLQAAENVVLPNDGEQLVLTCGTDQEALRTQLDK